MTNEELNKIENEIRVTRMESDGARACAYTVLELIAELRSERKWREDAVKLTKSVCAENGKLREALKYYSKLTLVSEEGYDVALDLGERARKALKDE